VWDGNVTIESGESSGVDGAGCSEKRHQVGVSSSQAIGRDLDDEKVDDGACNEMLVDILFIKCSIQIIIRTYREPRLAAFQEGLWK
jgi:hypothetical protein